MHRTLVIAATLAFAAAAGSAHAAPCKDAKGKFIKCPVAVAPTMAKHCKDAKGKFMKCSAPGARPV